MGDSSLDIEQEWREDYSTPAHFNDHADCDPDECLTAKLRYWRTLKDGPAMILPDSFKAAAN